MHKQEENNNKKSNTLIRVHEYTDYSQWLVDKHFEEVEKGKDTTLIKTQVDFWNETYKGDKERKKWVSALFVFIALGVVIAVFTLLLFLPIWEGTLDTIKNLNEIRIALVTYLLAEKTAIGAYLGFKKTKEG